MDLAPLSNACAHRCAGIPDQGTTREVIGAATRGDPGHPLARLARATTDWRALVAPDSLGWVGVVALRHSRSWDRISEKRAGRLRMAAPVASGLGTGAAAPTA